MSNKCPADPTTHNRKGANVTIILKLLKIMILQEECLENYCFVMFFSLIPGA